MTYLSPIDVNEVIDWLVAQTLECVPWLTQVVGGITYQNVYPTDPGVIYAGLKPYGVWLSPRHSTANRESGEIGNIEGNPNTYLLSYREFAFASQQDFTAEQRRAYDAYSRIAAHLIPADPNIPKPCPPSGQQIDSVSMEHEIGSVYIQTLSGPYIGVNIIVRLEERYPTGSG